MDIYMSVYIYVHPPSHEARRRASAKARTPSAPHIYINIYIYIYIHIYIYIYIYIYIHIYISYPYINVLYSTRFIQARLIVQTGRGREGSVALVRRGARRAALHSHAPKRRRHLRDGVGAASLALSKSKGVHPIYIHITYIICMHIYI